MISVIETPPPITTIALFSRIVNERKIYYYDFNLYQKFCLAFNFKPLKFKEDWIPHFKVLLEFIK